MDYIHEKQDDRCYECYKDPHNSNVGSDHFANAQDLVYYPLKPSHVTLLHKLVLQHAVLYLLLGEVYVVWEQLKKLLPRPAFPLFLLLQFQVTHVDS